MSESFADLWNDAFADDAPPDKGSIRMAGASLNAALTAAIAGTAARVWTPAATSGTTGYPTTGGSGSGGAIMAGNAFTALAAGFIRTVPIREADIVVAKVDSPGQTASNWAYIPRNFGYTPENASNKVTAWSSPPSHAKYPSEKLVNDSLSSVATALTALQTDVANRATEATQAVAVAGVASVGVMTARRVTDHFNARTSTFSRSLLTGTSAAAIRAALDAGSASDVATALARSTAALAEVSLTSNLASQNAIWSAPSRFTTVLDGSMADATALVLEPCTTDSAKGHRFSAGVVAMRERFQLVRGKIYAASFAAERVVEGSGELDFSIQWLDKNFQSIGHTTIQTQVPQATGELISLTQTINTSYRAPTAIDADFYDGSQQIVGGKLYPSWALAVSAGVITFGRASTAIYTTYDLDGIETENALISGAVGIGSSGLMLRRSIINHMPYGSMIDQWSKSGTVVNANASAGSDGTNIADSVVAETVLGSTIRTSSIDVNWLSVCWSPELLLYVAVAASGTGNRVMTSPDGINWTIRTSAADNSWTSVCWAPGVGGTGLFVAVAITGTGNRVMTSPDGINWTIRVSAADNDWRAVCWAPGLGGTGLFVAVAETGIGNRVMTSPDGINWTIRTSAADNVWRSVCWAAGISLFVAVAASGAGNRVMTSPDGINWTSRTSAADNNWRSVCWSPGLGLLVAVSDTGTGNRVMTSTNGTSWTIRTSAANNDWYSVTWSPEAAVFVAISNTGVGNRVMTSTNGTSWTSRTSAADLDWRGVIWSPTRSLFVAVAASGVGNRVMTSPDGTTWTIRLNGIDNGWQSIAWSPSLGLFVAVATTGTGARVMTSTNGVNWIVRSSAADNNWYCVIWAAELGLFVACANSGTGNRIMTSPDGINWTARTTPADNSWYSLAWAPGLGGTGLLVCVAITGVGNRVMTSPDGINWTIRTSASDNNWTSVAWSPSLGLFAAVSGGGVNPVMTSPDGINWTSRAGGAGIWRSICWSPERALFVAVNSSGVTNSVMTSPDGIAWTLRTAASTNQWFYVAWAAGLGLFAAVSITGTGNRIMTSPDGITWTSRTSPVDNNWQSLCWSQELGIFASVSNNGTSNRVMTLANSSVQHYVQQAIPTAISNGDYVSAVVDLRADTQTFAQVSFTGSHVPANAYINVNMATGQITYAGPNLVRYGIKRIRTGLYRAYVEFQATQAFSGTWYARVSHINAANAALNPSYPALAEAFSLSGVQMQIWPSGTPLAQRYRTDDARIPNTTAGTVTKAADQVVYYVQNNTYTVVIRYRSGNTQQLENVVVSNGTWSPDPTVLNETFIRSIEMVDADGVIRAPREAVFAVPYMEARGVGENSAVIINWEDVTNARTLASLDRQYIDASVGAQVAQAVADALAFVTATAARRAPTIAAAAALALSNGMTVRVEGWSSAGDGRGGDFIYLLGSSLTADTGTVYAATGGRLVRKEFIEDGKLRLVWYGASPTGASYADGARDALKAAYSALGARGVVLPPVVETNTTSLMNVDNLRLYGAAGKTVWKAGPNVSNLHVNLDGVNVEMHDIIFDGVAEGKTAGLIVVYQGKDRGYFKSYRCEYTGGVRENGGYGDALVVAGTATDSNVQVIINDPDIYATQGSGLSIQQANNVSMENFNIRDIGGTAVSINNYNVPVGVDISRRIRIRGGQIRNVRDAMQVSNYLANNLFGFGNSIFTWGNTEASDVMVTDVMVENTTHQGFVFQGKRIVVDTLVTRNTSTVERSAAAFLINADNFSVDNIMITEANGFMIDAGGSRDGIFTGVKLAESPDAVNALNFEGTQNVLFAAYMIRGVGGEELINIQRTGAGGYYNAAFAGGPTNNIHIGVGTLELFDEAQVGIRLADNPGNVTIDGAKFKPLFNNRDWANKLIVGAYSAIKIRNLSIIEDTPTGTYGALTDVAGKLIIPDAVQNFSLSDIDGPPGQPGTINKILTYSQSLYEGCVAWGNITNQGADYTWAEAVVSGDGTGASFAVFISAGEKKVVGLKLLTKGTGYTWCNITIIGDGTGATATSQIGLPKPKEWEATGYCNEQITFTAGGALTSPSGTDIVVPELGFFNFVEFANNWRMRWATPA